MCAVQAKSQAKKVGLFGFAAEAVIGEVAQFVGFQIENRERLLFVGGVGAVAAVKENGEAAVRGNGGGSGKVIDAAWIAGEFAKDFGIWNLCMRGRCGVLRRERKGDG